MLVMLTFSFLVSALLSFVLIVNARTHARRYGHNMPQRFHKGNVPRVGGVAIALASFAACCLAAASSKFKLPINVSIDWRDVMLWSIALAPVLIAGVYEDLTQKIGVKWRLAASLLTGALACSLLGLAVPRFGIDSLDALWTANPWLAVAFALLAIAGLPHAFNIIDGYNGLAGLVAMLVCTAIAYVALQQGDRNLAGLMASLIGATAGFLFWNYPRGLIFAGDGGAYFWGGAVAIACVTLIQRHPAVSPWFVMLLLIYPVWETLFSIYRRFMRGNSPGAADALHFHQLIYRRVVRNVAHEDVVQQMRIRNNRTSPFLWGLTALTVIPAMLFWSNTPVLMVFCALFAATYLGAYIAIVRFKVPKWLK